MKNVDKISNPLFKLKKIGITQMMCTEHEIFYDEDNFLKANPSKMRKIYEFKYYENDEHNSLPLEGWIKPCVCCMSYTSTTIVYQYPLKVKYQYFRIHICHSCMRKNKLEFLERIKRYSLPYIKTLKYYKPTKLF